MEHLLNVVKKELLELVRDQRFIASLAITLAMFPLMGALMGGVFKSARESGVVVGFVDLDRGEFSELIKEALSANSTLVELSSLEEAGEGLDVIVVVPPRFSANLSEGRRGVLETYAVLTGTSLSSTIKASRGMGVVRGAAEAIIRALARRAGVSPELLLQPFESRARTIYRGRVVEADPALVTGIIASQSTTVPWVMFILILMTAQLAVTSMALEKENKTLELLLSQPVKRTTILAGKLIAALVLSLINAAVFFVGFMIYMAQIVPPEAQGFGAFETEELASLGLLPTLPSVILMLANILLGLLAIMCLSLVIGAAAEDVRSAQSLFGIIVPLILLPALALMFADLEAMPLAAKAIVLVDPFTHPMLAVRAAFENDYATLLASAVYLVAFSGASLYVASKLFASERILTLRIRWGRARRLRQLRT